MRILILALPALGARHKIMGREIERKFLVASEDWRASIIGSHKLRDGLVARFGEGKVRVRVSDETASITIKGPRDGLGRAEFEYEIPRDEAEEILRTLCDGPVIKKARFYVADGPLVWTVDGHEGDLEGVVLAEIELEDEEQPVTLPAWIGREVTGDPRFRKRALVDWSVGARQLALDPGGLPGR